MLPADLNKLTVDFLTGPAPQPKSHDVTVDNTTLGDNVRLIWRERQYGLDRIPASLPNGPRWSLYGARVATGGNRWHIDKAAESSSRASRPAARGVTSRSETAVTPGGTAP
jgi:hypothetical protein